MIRYLSAILLLLAFAAQTFNGPFIQLGYYLNPAAYAKHCINKARPKLHCNGKCQLMKKIREEERKEQENLEQKWEIKVTVFAPKPVCCSIELTDIPLTKPSPVQNILLVKDIAGSVFHPPQA